MTEARKAPVNYSRQAEIPRVRERRVICGYVELKYPEIYKEAFKFYEFLNVKHPGKKDLRKTKDFQMLKIPGQTIKKYYTQEEKGPNIEVSNKKDMELIIPLMKLPVSTQEIGSSSDVSTQEIEVSSEIPAQEIVVSSEVSTQEIEVSSEIPAQEIVVSSEVSTQEIESLGHIPDEIIEEIMATLREDPDLHALFNDIDIDIDMEEQSPLETELMCW